METVTFVCKIAFSMTSHIDILNLLITLILESDLTSVALLGIVLFNLPFSNFPLYCSGFLDSATNARRCSRTDLKSDELFHFYSISCKQCEIQCYI